MTTKSALATLAVLTPFLMAGCGGGGDTAVADPFQPPPADADRVAAATTTANTNALCAESALGPFYWEIGDKDGKKVSGTVGSSVTATTKMSIASASKWVYSTYVLQKVGSRAADVKFLNFTSGYTEFSLPLCAVTDTVSSCVDGKDGQQAATIGKFAYSSGHMQHHAIASMGLGDMGNAALTAEVAGTVGGFGFEYTQPQLAGGLVADASGYAAFLRSMLRGDLAMAAVLGTNKVCANPESCPDTAVESPIKGAETWNYSLGHWVEDDPVVGDHAFSSAGALGFYPWIDSSKTLYGVLARRASGEQNAGYNSARCGRLIRQAWVTGKAV